jgi:hypothetical protein
MNVSKRELERLYSTENLPVPEVMKRLKIRSTRTLYRLLRQAGIELRKSPPAMLVD